MEFKLADPRNLLLPYLGHDPNNRENLGKQPLAVKVLTPLSLSRNCGLRYWHSSLSGGTKVTLVVTIADAGEVESNASGRVRNR